MMNEVPRPYTTALAKGRAHVPQHRCTCIDGVPRPWTNALEVRRAASGATAAVPQVLRDSDGVPKPWSSALAARNRSEVR